MRSAPSRQTRGLAAIVVAYLALALAYSLSVPAFEAPDEQAHLHYMVFVARHHRLPNQLRVPPEVPGEGHQPPLYYLLLAPAAARANLPDQLLADINYLDWLSWQVPAPEAWARYASRPHLLELNPKGPPDTVGAGCAHFRLDRHNEFAPGSWRRAVHGLRLASIPLSLVVVICAYLLALRLGLESGYAALAAGLVAFLPQFLFVSGVLGNDPPANALAAVALALWVRWWRSGLTTLRALVLGGLTGVGVLAKYSAAYLWPIGLLGCLLLARPPRRAVTLAALVTIAMLAVSAPLLIRNQVLYGDPLGSAMQRITLVGPNPPIDRSWAGGYYQREFPLTLLLSFRATFGHMNLLGSFRGALVYYGIVALGLVGLGGWLLRRRESTEDRAKLTLTTWLVAACAMLLALIIHYNLTFPQAQGRYLFPALPAFATLVALGIRRLAGTRPLLVRWTPLVLALLLLLAAVYELVSVIVPAYWG